MPPVACDSCRKSKRKCVAHEDGPGQGPCKTCSDTGLECVYSKPIPKPPAAAQGLAEETSNSSSFTAGGLAGFRQAAVAGGGGAVDFYGNGFGFDELHRMQMWEHFNNAGLAFQLASTKAKQQHSSTSLSPSVSIVPIGPFTLSAHIPENVSVCLDLLMSDASQKQQMDQTDLASHLISEFFNTNVSAFALYDQTDFIISLKQQQNSLTSPLSLSLSNIGNNTISSRRASSFSEKSSSASIIAPPSSSLALEPPPDYLLHAMFAVTAAKSNHPALLNQDSNNIFWNSPETAAAYWADLAFKAVCTSSVSTSTTSISTSLHIHQTMLILVDYYNSQQDIQKCVFLMFELIKVAKFHAWGKLAVEDIQGNGNQTTVTVKNALMYKLVWACVFWYSMSFSSWLDFNFGDEFDFYHMMDEQYWIQAGLVPDDHPRIKLVNQLCLSHSISSTLIAIISQHFFLQREVAQCITSYTNPLANFSSSSGKASKIINPYGVPSAIDRLIQQVRPVPDIESVHMSLLGWFESLNKRYQCFTKISDFVNGPHLLSPTILTHLHDGAIFVDIMFLATLARLHAVNHRSANSAFQFLVSSSSPVTSSSSSITTTGGTAAGGPLSTPSSTSLFDSKEYLTKATSCDIILLASFALTSILATGVSVDQSPASTEFIYSVLKRNQVAKAIAIIMDALICVLESEVGWAKMDDAKNLTLDAMCNLYLPILSSAANGGNGSVMMDYTALSASVSRFTVALQHHHHQQQQEQTKQNGEGDNFVNFCMMDTALELEESGVLRAS